MFAACSPLCSFLSGLELLSRVVSCFKEKSRAVSWSTSLEQGVGAGPQARGQAGAFPYRH